MIEIPIRNSKLFRLRQLLLIQRYLRSEQEAYHVGQRNYKQRKILRAMGCPRLYVQLPPAGGHVDGTQWAVLNIRW